MGFEIVSLMDENLIEAPEWEEHPFSCKYCLYWEFPEERVDPSRESREEMLAKKLNWLRSMRNAFGDCGKIMHVDGKTVGYAQYAPRRCFHFQLNTRLDHLGRTQYWSHAFSSLRRNTEGRAW